MKLLVPKQISKNSLVFYKKLFFAVLCFTSLQVQAQPDLQKSIFIAEKHCWDFNYTDYDDMTYVPNVDLFAVCFRFKKLYDLGPNNHSGVDIVMYRIDATTYDTLWSKAYGGSRNEDNTDLHINTLPNGNLLISGTTESYDMDFASNPLQFGLAVFFLEVDTAGAVVRTKLLNGTGGAIGNTLRDVVVDAQGNIYGTGSTWHSTLDFAHVENGKDAYVVKLDTNLNKEWMRFWVGYDGYGTDQALGLGLIHGGNVAVTGTTSDTGTTAMLSNLDQGKGDLFIEAYSPQGVSLWKNRLGGKESESGRQVVYGPNTNDIYVIGETYSATGDIGYHTAKVDQTFNYPYRLENSNLWILKLDTMGNMIHSKAYGSRSYANYPQYETHYEDAIWYNGELWIAMRSDLGGGDFDPIYVNGANKILIGTMDNKANLTSKVNFNETSVKNIHSFFSMEQKLYAMGLSKHQMAVPINTFSCDSAVDDVSFLLNITEAPLSLSKIEGAKEAELFKLYPNPSSDNIHIELLSKALSQKPTLLITDANGRSLKRKRLRKKINTINISLWPSGPYYIKLQTQDAQQTRKIMKR